MTKALSNDKTTKYVEIFDGQIMQTTDQKSLSIRYLGSKDEKRTRAIETHCLEVGIDGVCVKAWTRLDINSRTLRTIAKGVHSLSNVVAKISLDANRQKTLLSQAAADICRNREHALVEDGPVDLETVLVYKA